MTEKKKTSKKTSTLKWVIAGLIVVIIFGGFRYWSAKKQAELRRAEMQEQRQVMVDFFEKQGLSDEEIEEKLREAMSSRRELEGQKSSGFGIMKIMGGRK